MCPPLSQLYRLETFPTIAVTRGNMNTTNPREIETGVGIEDLRSCKAAACTEMASDDLYMPLDPVRKQIRLLRLAPPERQNLDADICCTLETVEMGSVESYLAISYVWGSPLDTIPIWINDKQHHVTKNLHDALSVFRRKGVSNSPLWVRRDASVCSATGYISY